MSESEEPPAAGNEVDALFAAAYRDLRQLARARLRAGGRNTLLDTTALVHESYLRLSKASDVQFRDRARFLVYAGRAMRSIIVDFARQRLTDRGAARRALVRRRLRAGTRQVRRARSAGQAVPAHRSAERRLGLAADRQVRRRDGGGRHGDRRGRPLGACIEGVTFHVGSQCRNPNNWRVGIQRTRRVFCFLTAAGMRPSLLDIGGGFPVQLTKPIPSIEAIGAVVGQELSAFDRDIPVVAPRASRWPGMTR